MRRNLIGTGLIVTTGALGLAGLIAAAAHRQPGSEASRPRIPVLAELFTSEGCSSCPPADDVLRHLLDEQPIDGVEVIGLSEHVDYWDRLGWKDPFSSPRFTQRQQAYAQAFRSAQIYTPQLVIDGRLEVVGSDLPAIGRALADSAQTPRAVVEVSGKPSADGKAASVRVAVRAVPAAAAGARALVTIAIVEDDLVTEVARGENARKRLRHSAVARALETIGALASGASSGEFARQVDLDSGWRRERLRVVAFVQDARTQAVVGAGAAGFTP
jgi:hypothetical protein